MKNAKKDGKPFTILAVEGLGWRVEFLIDAEQAASVISGNDVEVRGTLTMDGYDFKPRVEYVALYEPKKPAASTSAGNGAAAQPAAARA